MNTQTWIAHFERNRRYRPEPDWAAPFTMAEGKRAKLARSLAEYQLGDGGGECCLVAHDAERFRGARKQMDRLVDLWFREEAEHSRLLSCAVERVGGTFVTDTPAMRLFYAIRRSFGVQFEMLVLLIVEIVSTTYYRCIRRHVGDAPLAAMCALIIRDETGHVAFHRARLAEDYPGGVGLRWAVLFHLLGAACAVFLWIGKNGAGLRAIGTTGREFFGQVYAGLRRFTRQLHRDTLKTPAADARLQAV